MELGILTIGLYTLETVMIIKAREIIFSKLGGYHEYDTRNRNEMARPIETNSLDFFRMKPSVAVINLFYKVPQEFYKVPQEILSKSNLNLFKKNLKNYLIGSAHYSLNEFLKKKILTFVFIRF